MAKASPPLFSQGAGSAGISIPSLTRGKAPSPNVRGAERRKARVDISTPCGARPMTLGVRLAALHCGVFLRPRDRLLKTAGAAIAKLLDSAGFFAPAFIRSTSPLPDGPT